ncbi:carboxypeptidase-like regulatory domain-containing protein [Nannocystis pusilla]|uniref:Carboxypeptidase-like regulatory domain-containing protein n=1 Tax=Nannocystis pusilla TaxID=889268 RepID=A0A9X3ENV2_9BACT|nr:carboxypeptidase-like regulatory domain-containing protein [Nannocystis pusilla]MCY1007547.1 carboxypeptidase-like regulatory domain-containing protein [Nannocystis pusilla]
MRRAAVVAALLALLAALAVWLGRSERPGPRPPARKNKAAATQVTAAVEGEAPVLGVARRADVDRSGEGVVRGRIVDRDGSPVSDGRIILHCLPSGSDRSAPIDGGVVEPSPEGEFSGPGCRGIVCAELRHPTLVPRDSWVLEPNRTPVTLVAQALSRVVGSVSDGEGRAVAGAQIWVRRGADDDPAALPPFTSRNTVSDGEGFFSFARVEKPPCDPCGEASGRCEPGDARDVPTYASLMLIARAPGFRPTEKEVSVDEEEGWQIVLAPPLSPLQGTVTDAEGRGYARARVLARAHTRGYEVHQARVEAGQFSLAELGEGSYDLRVVQDGVEAGELGRTRGRRDGGAGRGRAGARSRGHGRGGATRQRRAGGRGGGRRRALRRRAHGCGGHGGRDRGVAGDVHARRAGARAAFPTRTSDNSG